MADTSIEWTDAVWNCARGCSRVSPGCGGAKGVGGCYAERMAARMSGPGQSYHGLVRKGPQGWRWTGKVVIDAEKLAAPLSWRKPRRVFVNSMSDLFHEALSDEQIAAVFGVMAACPQHTFQVLTKRAERMRAWFEWAAPGGGELRGDVLARLRFHATRAGGFDGHWPSSDVHYGGQDWPLKNLWLGVSIEDQQCADERIPHLLACPAAVRFLSCEPLLAPIDLRRYLVGAPRVDWIIVGGES